MNPYRLLIVDDDEAFRERLARAMRDRDFDTRSATDTSAARQVLKAWRPSHALVDLKMPGESGLALIPDLHSLPQRPRIVVLTGFGSIATAVEAIRLGADDYLTKPTDADRIEAALLRSCAAKPAVTSIPPPSLDRVEWEHIQRVLNDCGGNISQAARFLGIERRTLQRKLQKYPPST